MKTAILLLGHGSRAAGANDALYAVAALVKDDTGAAIVEVAFLAPHLTSIQEGIDRCVAQGAARVLLYPYFLYAGAHVLKDLPDEIAQARRRHPGLEMILGQPLGVHRKLAEIVRERIDASLQEAGWSL
ncbi:sirohydrochlorin chelatase [Trichloromonas sp.]|uniref:sirohydrochlorin chelatase n=1 Tax=Trichloromonas sp. TaxID=3069249 RepID=UPI002A3978A5|nr:CbiX/SirB N-terminal domain-containing protein [Trichloromonas sp.]